MQKWRKVPVLVFILVVIQVFAYYTLETNKYKVSYYSYAKGVDNSDIQTSAIPLIMEGRYFNIMTVQELEKEAYLDAKMGGTYPVSYVEIVKIELNDKVIFEY